MTHVVITGANRGIGLALTKQYAEAGAQVTAGCRHPDKAAELQALTKGHDVSVVPLDVTDGQSVAAFAKAMGDRKIDILINNAGVMPGNQNFGSVDYDAWETAFAVNTMGPLRVTEALTGALAPGAKVIVISSQLGSFALGLPNMYIYASTKAGANKVVQSLAHDLAPQKATVITMHPGWVRTDMGTDAADISPQESAEGIRSVIAGLTPKDNGRFIKWNGEEHPW